MKVVVHLSDLHFGRENPTVVEALLDAVSALRPSVVAVSGDLTQRARAHQFVRARRFLDALPFPRVVVPGNHDVPLFNVFARLFDPLGGYRRHVTTDLAPAFADPPVVVFGVNTTRPSSIKAARVHLRDVNRILESIRRFDAGVVKILVAHHPFDGHSHAALDALTRGGIDVILTGHLHVSSTTDTATRHDLSGRCAVVVEAGTATSTRLRETTNAFNVVRVDAGMLAVERYEWRSSAGFEPVEYQQFERTVTGWEPRA